MTSYNFKNIMKVPPASDFVNIMLSKTQRKTPTVIRKHYKISRIRAFYMRKVKYTHSNIIERMEEILAGFPKLDDIHPFYSDLLNVLYDKDHYKLALSQVNTARHLIGNVCKDYSRLLKYGDSLYRCKQMKRAALGRMVKIIKRQAASLEYLEQVRQHMSRLPSIDPNTRTILITGFPNVGKSSFINKVTRADVEVESYAFTTKSLYVGHMDYKYLRWQVIDTPGLLDHPLEERNTIEMQAITALAHLKAAIVYIMDPSEQCDNTIEDQISLFNNIRPLFANKPLVVVCNKTDVKKLSELTDEQKQLFKPLEEDGIPILEMSTVSEEGVMEVKQKTCDMLLEHRVQVKMKGRKVNDVINRLHVATPQPRDKVDRSPYIPSEVHEKKNKMVTEDEDGVEDKEERKLEKDLMNEQGDDYILDLKKKYILNDETWKYDKIPEFFMGRNVADYIDTNILDKLSALEKEEALRISTGVYESDESDDEMQKDIHRTADKIREKIGLMQIKQRLAQPNSKIIMPRKSRKRERSTSRLRGEMEELGVDMSETGDAHFTRTTSRARSASAGPLVKKARSDEFGTTRSKSRAPRDQSGVRDPEMKDKLLKIRKGAQKPFIMEAKKGEGDRHIFDKKPKHLFSGKMQMGKKSRR